MNLNKLFRRCPQITIITLVMALAIPPANAWLVWVISDGIRDGNWWLKLAREAILQTERLTNYAKQMAQDKQLIDSIVKNSEANSSTKIQAITTAKSETKNTYSEERYSFEDLHGFACGAINRHAEMNAAYSCESVKTSLDGNAKLINQTLGSAESPERVWHDKLNALSRRSTQPDADKKLVETYALSLDSIGQTASRMTLLTLNEYDEAMDTIDLVFSQGINVPNAESIMNTELPNGVHELDSLRKSLLYKSFIQENLNRRTIRGKLAIDGAFIDDGSMEAYLSRIETINDVTMSPNLITYQALFTAKQLNAKFTETEKSLRRATVNALKYKELRNNNDG